MKKHLRPFLVVLVLALLGLALAACEKDRPAVVPVTETPGAARGTVAPTPTPPIASTPLGGDAGTQLTPVAGSPTPPSAQSPSDGPSFTYTVVEGDTLASIAARFGVTQDAIVQLNSLADPNTLALGQLLRVPGSASAGGTTTGGSAGSTYVVQSGDTLNAIARRFNTTAAELIRLNNLTDPDRISVGQRLVVPGGSSTTSGTTGGRRTYTVQSGDTLNAIARQFGVTAQQIQEANNISNPDRIVPGQVLVIP